MPAVPVEGAFHRHIYPKQCSNKPFLTLTCEKDELKQKKIIMSDWSSIWDLMALFSVTHTGLCNRYRYCLRRSFQGINN